MFLLEKILAVKKAPKCYCGREIENNFCVIHGADIRITSEQVKAQFTFTGLSNELPGKNEAIKFNIELPLNQFRSLFSSKDLTYKKPKMRYLIAINAFGKEVSIDDLVEDFLFHLDFDHFWGMKRLQEKQIRPSGIRANFLFDFQIDNGKLLLECELVLSRSLRDYIQWRQKQLGSKQKNIIASLHNSRSFVFSSKGEKIHIESIKWSERQKMPDLVVARKDRAKESKQYKITELYQGMNDFFLGPRMEGQLVNALASFSNKLKRSFEQFLVANSCVGELKKLNVGTEIELEQFLGKKVISNRYLLLQIERKLNQQISKQFVNLSFLDPKEEKSNRKLLVLMESEMKITYKEKKEALVSNYGFPSFIIKWLLVEKIFPSNIDLMLLTNFGLLNASVRKNISYDPISTEIIGNLSQQVEKEQVSDYDTVIFELPHDLTIAEQLKELFLGIDTKVVFLDQSTTSARMKKLVALLFSD